MSTNTIINIIIYIIIISISIIMLIKANNKYKKLKKLNNENIQDKIDRIKEGRDKIAQSLDKEFINATNTIFENKSHFKYKSDLYDKVRNEFNIAYDKEEDKHYIISELLKESGANKNKYTLKQIQNNFNWYINTLKDKHNKIKELEDRLQELAKVILNNNAELQEKQHNINNLNDKLIIISNEQSDRLLTLTKTIETYKIIFDIYNIKYEEINNKLNPK